MNPENNDQVQVFHFTSVKKDGALHDGFEIAMEVDMRYLLEDKYSAHLISSNEIMICLPSMSYTFLYNSEAHTKRLMAMGSLCPRTEEVHDVARNQILSERMRQTRHLLLQFPVDLELSNDIYSPESEEGEIEFESVPTVEEIEFNNESFKITTLRVSWKVSLIEKKKRSVKKGPGKKEKERRSKLGSRPLKYETQLILGLMNVWKVFILQNLTNNCALSLCLSSSLQI